jgi:glycosyltransferase involved in cell wall biosynthesis
LFESLLQLANDGYDFELTIVGDGSDRQALEQLAQRLGIGPRLVFTGYLSQQDMQRHLQESDVFILPSFAEGVPVSLMEAMACGVPVLATHVGGVVELVEPGRTGLLVPPADSAALRDAIARYLDDFELRERVSRLGRDMVAKHFNLDTQINELARLFLASAENGTCPNG